MKFDPQFAALKLSAAIFLVVIILAVYGMFGGIGDGPLIRKLASLALMLGVLGLVGCVVGLRKPKKSNSNIVLTF